MKKDRRVGGREEQRKAGRKETSDFLAILRECLARPLRWVRGTGSHSHASEASCDSPHGPALGCLPCPDTGWEDPWGCSAFARMKGSDFYYRVTSFYLISLATISRTMSDRTLMADTGVTVGDVQENTTNFSSLNCNSAGQQVRQCGDTRAKRSTPLRGEGGGWTAVTGSQAARWLSAARPHLPKLPSLPPGRSAAAFILQKHLHRCKVRPV